MWSHKIQLGKTKRNAQSPRRQRLAGRQHRAAVSCPAVSSTFWQACHGGEQAESKPAGIFLKCLTELRGFSEAEKKPTALHCLLYENDHLCDKAGRAGARGQNAGGRSVPGEGSRQEGAELTSDGSFLVPRLVKLGDIRSSR